MTTWKDFTEAAPKIAEIFVRRHAATGNLCMLSTLRKDGFPRISPLEPRIFEDHLILAGMPGTTKFDDLVRDPRFCLHTATVDPNVKEGDVKLFGTVHNLQDKELHQRFAQKLFDDVGFDLRGRDFDPFYVVDLTGASSVIVADGHMDVTVWKPGETERIVRKH